MAFEWDERKRQANLVKHGVDFRRMPQLFDGDTVETVDDRQDYGETRINCLGEIGNNLLLEVHPGAVEIIHPGAVEVIATMKEGRVYAVAYTWRGANRRIISARKANAREQETYYARVKR